MYISSNIFKPLHTSFENFIKAEIYKLSNGKIKIYEISNLLNPNSLKNIFTYNEYEINILKLYENIYKIMIYKPELDLDISSNIFNFGCELETCLDLGCIEPMSEKVISLFTELKSTRDKIVWKDLIILYIQEVIVKYASSEFKRLFPKICVAINPKSNLIDYIIDTSTGTIEENIIVNFNEYITFTRDSSLICGDRIKNKTFTKYTNIKENTIHCEIITPTMSSVSKLEILYNSIVNPRCLNYNPSTAFHVNLSFIKPVYFSFGLCDEIIQNYKIFESKDYRIKEKSKQTKYAPRIFNTMIYNILKENGSIIYHGDMESYKYSSGKFLNEGYYRSFIDFNEKYSSIYCKSNQLVELRLFSSDNEVKNLLVYLKHSIELLQKSYENYRNNFNKGFEELQNINLKTGIDFSPLEYYEGPLYSIDTDYSEYDKIMVLRKNKSLESTLDYLFKKRHQIFIDINRYSDDEYIIRTDSKNGLNGLLL